MSEHEDDIILTDISKISEEIKTQSKRNHTSIIIRSFFSLAIMSLLATYLFSPLGKVKINNLSGNYYLNKDDVIRLSGLSNDSSLLKVNVEKTMLKLNESPYISRSRINWHLTYVNVYVDEVAPIAKSEDDEILLTNGYTLRSYQAKYKDYSISNYNVDESHLPVFVNYNTDSSSGVALLNGLKSLDKELYDDYLVKLDESLIILKEKPVAEKYYGLYFYLKDSDKTLRIRINNEILKEALLNKEVFMDAIKNIDFYTKTNEVYEGVYYKVNNSYRIATFEEVANNDENN